MPSVTEHVDSERLHLRLAVALESFAELTLEVEKKLSVSTFRKMSTKADRCPSARQGTVPTAREFALIRCVRMCLHTVGGGYVSSPCSSSPPN